MDSKYILLVSRNSSPFGGGGGNAAFAVDGIFAEQTTSGDAICMRGWRGEGPARRTVVEFPVGMQYILVENASITRTSPAELLKQQIKEDKELEAIHREANPVSKDSSTEILPLAGQYL